MRVLLLSLFSVPLLPPPLLFISSPPTRPSPRLVFAPINSSLLHFSFCGLNTAHNRWLTGWHLPGAACPCGAADPVCPPRPGECPPGHPQTDPSPTGVFPRIDALSFDSWECCGAMPHRNLLSVCSPRNGEIKTQLRNRMRPHSDEIMNDSRAR